MNKEKLEKLKQKHAKEIEALEFESKYEDLPGLRFVSQSGGDWVCLECETREQASEVLHRFPPTNSSFKMEFAGKDSYTVESPYKVSTTSQVRGNVEAEIVWQSEGVEVHMNIPIEFISDYIRFDTRKVTDCEYHYFGGISMAEINRMNIRMATFPNGNQAYHGGYNKLKCAETANSLVKSLM